MITAQVLAKKFSTGENVYNVDVETWLEAFRIIDTNAATWVFAKGRVHSIWIESGGHLRRKIRDDQLILRVLKRALPGYEGPGLALYRGECRFLFEAGQLGFCWTPDLSVAEMFARGLNALESGGVLLKAYAPAKAILAGPNSHSEHLQEHEYTCDPTQIQSVEVLRHFPQPR